jgi:hypothetical protein
MKRALTLLPVFCSTAVAAAIFTLIVLGGYSRFVRPENHAQASATPPNPLPVAQAFCNEGPILVPHINQKFKEPHIQVQLFALSVGDSIHLPDPAKMKPRLVEITSLYPVRLVGSKCKSNTAGKIWFCADTSKNIYLLDSRPSDSDRAFTNTVAVSWLEY